MKIVVISHPENFKHEKEILIRLFEEGLEYFHLRKHDFSKTKIEKYLDHLPKEYHNRIIIYDHFDLVDTYKLKGMHFNRKTKEKVGVYNYLLCHKSFSAHSFEEIKDLHNEFDYVFISPVFDSISKNGYTAKITPEEIESFINSGECKHEIVALGGITEHNARELMNKGIAGVALLGNIWTSYFESKNIDLIVKKFREIKQIVQSGRPYCMSIAGFDPSSGAGVTADIKTMEVHEVYGLGICSAITCQNEDEFASVDWLSADKIIAQAEMQFKKHPISVVKIGIIESLSTLNKVIDRLKQLKPDVKIIWDPVIKSTSGFSFHSSIDKSILNEILRKIYLVTPNALESRNLFDTDNPEKIRGIIKSGGFCNVLLKGGHIQSDVVNDFLIMHNDTRVFEGGRYSGIQKHGTGCVLSSAIASRIARGVGLESACEKGKKYTERFILSNNLRLGYHYCSEVLRLDRLH